MTFKDHAFRSGFKIVAVDALRHHHQQQDDQEESITGCIIERVKNVNSTDTVASTCHVGTVVRLRANQTVAVATIDGYYKPMLMSDYLTYWGLYKVD